MANENYLLRGARNTLLDMLLDAVAVTYPLFDLPVKAVQEVVFYNHEAELVVSNSQPDIIYQLFEDINDPGKEHFTDTRGDLPIQTGKLNKQVHAFRVKATKMYPPQLSNTLYRVVNVRVGINDALEVNAQKAILNYGEKAVLTVKNAQRGAWYSIICFSDSSLPADKLFTLEDAKTIEKIAVPGHAEALVLSSKLFGDNADLEIGTLYGLRENMDLRIFVEDANTGLFGLLSAEVSISVIPKLDIPAFWYGGKSKAKYNKTGAAEYGSKVGVRLPYTQLSVKYRVRLDEVDEPDAATGMYLSDWVSGSADALDIALDIKAKEDLLLTVVAEKLSGPISGELTQRVVIPVYPAPVETLTVITNDGAENGKAIKISGAQRGIMYQLRNVKTNEFTGPPVFYHRNYGIGNMRIGGDNKADGFTDEELMSDNWWKKSQFVIGEFGADQEVLLPVGAITDDTSFEVIATKSTTGFSKVVGEITVIK